GEGSRTPTPRAHGAGREPGPHRADRSRPAAARDVVRDRAPARAAGRRRVRVGRGEGRVLTALTGRVPPLRAMWSATATLLVLLGSYVWALLTMKARADAHDPARPRRHAGARRRTPR